MPARTSPSSLVASAGLVLALLPVALLPQLVGGVHPEAAAAFAVVELVALALWWGGRASAGHGLRVSWLALPFVVGAVTTLLQVLPLPQALLDLLQAEAAALRRFVAGGLPEALREQVAPVTSLDPAETKAALLRLLGASALFVVVADAIRDQRRARLAWRLVLGTGALLFVSAAIHAVANAPGAWGSFSRLGGIFFAPIVNPNHLSKIFGGFALLALGRAVSAHSRLEALGAGAVFIACGGGVSLTLSRGGIVAFGVALLVWAGLWWRARRLEDDAPAADGTSRLALPALALSAILVVVVGVVVVADDAVMRELSTVSTELAPDNARSKLMVQPPALSLLSSHGVVGVGNNAFGVAFTSRSQRGHLVDDELYFSHPENLVVGTLVEHGLVVGGALLLLGVVIAVRLVGAARSRRLMAALPALAMLLVGDMVDFALETAAGLALVAVALALASVALPPRRRLSRSGAFVVVATAGVVVLATAPDAIRHWRFRLDREIATAPLSTRTATLHDVMAARPFDAVVATELAIDARERRQPKEALAWANRAINLWPTLTPAHLEAARAMAATGRLEQAMLSYRQATGGRHRTSGQALNEAFARTPDVRLRERALPDTASARDILCKRLEQERRLDEALACADVLAARTDATDLHRLEPLRLASRLDDSAANVGDLRRRVDDVLARGTPDGVAAAAVARALARLDGRDAALQTTSTWTTLGDPRALLEWRLAELGTAGQLDEARATLTLLRPLARTPAERDAHDRLEADLCAKAGDHGQRVLVLLRLAARHPGDAELLATLGLAEVAAGKTGAAHQTLRRVRETGRAPRSLRALEKALGLPPAPPATPR